MRTGSFLGVVWAICSLSTEIFATPDVKAVRLPFEKKRRVFDWDATPYASRIRRRRNVGKTALEKLDNKDYLFYANVTLGSPGQPLRLHIDTGSSDTWVEYANSDLCLSSESPCEVGGVYDNETSTTYEYHSSDFSIKYVDGSYATGDYGTDTFAIAGVEITDLQFGYGLDSSSEQGIMGIGFRGNEAQTSLGREPYDNLVYLMQKQGHINSVAYSLWLNDLDAQTGEILFGGIDTEKYQGNLTTLPIDKRSGATEATEFVITLTGVSLTNGAGDNKTVVDASSTGIPVLLDTGASFTYLPSAVANDLANEIGAEYNTAFRGPTLSCDKRGVSGTINFEFSGVTIRVPLDEFIVDVPTLSGNAYRDPSTGEVLCVFGIIGTDRDESSTLGDTFLRSAYVVYDLSNEEISLAQTLFNSTGTNILEIGTGKDSVPDAAGATSALTVAATGSRAGGVVSTGVPTTTSSMSSGRTTTTSASRTTTVAGATATSSTSTAAAVAGRPIESSSCLLGAFIWIAALLL